MRKENGFTLIELMVTIALMALFAAFAIPAMNGFLERQRVNSTLNNYTNALTFARNEAIRQNLPVVVCGANISSAGQLTASGCGTDWSEGVFVFGEANKTLGYQATGISTDINSRVVQSPNKSDGPKKVTIISSARDSIGASIDTNPTNPTNPMFQFLPNGQVARLSSGNLVVADMYLRLEIVSESDNQKKAVALMDPTGQIIRCTKKTIESNSSNGTSNNIAKFCLS